MTTRFRCLASEAPRSWPHALHSFPCPNAPRQAVLIRCSDSSLELRLLLVAQTFMRRRRSAFPTTDTELKLIAAAAMMGERRSPKNGYSAPAAIGTPTAL